MNIITLPKKEEFNWGNVRGKENLKLRDFIRKSRSTLTIRNAHTMQCLQLIASLVWIFGSLEVRWM